MYSPPIDPQLIKALYRIKRYYKKTITKLANELIEKSLHTIDKEAVCMTCIKENNQECDICKISRL